MIATVRSEFLKLRTTHTWWLMLLGLLGFTGLALAVNALVAHTQLQGPQLDTTDTPPEIQMQAQADYAAAHSAAGLAKIAASLYTSGQTMGGLFLLILGALIVTNEYFHQTATATFLATPQRTRVILAKLLTAVSISAVAWVLVTAVDLVVGSLYLRTEDVPSQLGVGSVTEAILLNLAVFAIWSVLGIALGTLIRSQIAAVVTGTVVYLIGTPVIQLAFMLVRQNLIRADWVLTAQVIIPGMASSVMTTPGGEAFEHAPDQWVGAAVLIGYGVVAGAIGTLLTRGRDIS